MVCWNNVQVSVAPSPVQGEQSLPGPSSVKPGTPSNFSFSGLSRVPSPVPVAPFSPLSFSGILGAPYPAPLAAATAGQSSPAQVTGLLASSSNSNVSSVAQSPAVQTTSLPPIVTGGSDQGNPAELPSNPPSPALSSVSMSSGTGFKFPQPKPFTGKPDEATGVIKSREFLAKCDIFFGFYKAQFKEDDTKTIFVLFLCEDAAYAWASVYIAAMGQEEHELHEVLKNWGTFKKAFLAQFGSVNPTKTATRDIIALSQAGKVSEYARTFRELAAQTKFDDSSKIAIYEKGLKDNIKLALANASVWRPDDYEEFVNWTIEIRDNLEFVKQTSGSGHQPIRPNKSRPSNQGGNRGDRPPASANRARSGLSREETERRIRENRCFTCNKVGHRSNDPAFHPKSNAGSGGPSSGGPTGLPQKAGNATHGKGRRYIEESDQGDESPDERITLDAASFRPSGSRYPWNEFEDVTLPSVQAKSWRAKN